MISFFFNFFKFKLFIFNFNFKFFYFLINYFCFFAFLFFYFFNFVFSIFYFIIFLIFLKTKNFFLDLHNFSPFFFNIFLFKFLYKVALFFLVFFFFFFLFKINYFDLDFFFFNYYYLEDNFSSFNQLYYFQLSYWWLFRVYLFYFLTYYFFSKSLILEQHLTLILAFPIVIAYFHFDNFFFDAESTDDLEFFFNFQYYFKGVVPLYLITDFVSKNNVKKYFNDNFDEKIYNTNTNYLIEFAINDSKKKKRF